MNETRKAKNGKGRYIDYLLVQKNLMVDLKKYEFLEKSDHVPLSLQMEIKQENLFQIPVIKAGQIHDVINKGGILSLEAYLQLCNSPKSFDVKYIEYNYVFKKTFSEQLGIVKPLLFSKESKEFHKLIQHSRNLKPYKKEGSIMNCVKHNGSMVQDYNQVTHLCINKLIEIQGKMELEIEQRYPYQIFLYYSEEMLEQLKNNKKALSYDLTELKYLVEYLKKQGGKLNLKAEVLKQFQYLFSMRLVPLNKAHPNLPIIDEFRPIMVQSHFIKLIVSYFVPKLRQICMHEIDPSQIGFVNKMAYQYHIASVIEQLKRKYQSKYQSKSVIFFDLSNAYNSVDRNRLFEVIKKRFLNNFCSVTEIDCLEWIYNQMYIDDPVLKYKNYFQFGVHQGSLLAPFLFDIYFNEVIIKLKDFIKIKCGTQKDYLNIRVRRSQRGFYEGVKMMAYADDLAIVVNHNIIDDISMNFMSLASEYNFKVNLNKTKLITRCKFRSIIGRIHKEKEFKYLGIFINARGDISRHLRYVKQVTGMIANQIKSLNKLLPLRHMTQLWNTYIRPHFQYVSPVLYTKSKTCQTYWEKLRRWSLKLTLGLPKTLSSRIIDGIWELFDFQTPFINRLKQIQGMTRQGGSYQIFLNQQYEFYRTVQKKRMMIRYFPDYGYLERHRFNWLKCKTCVGLRWSFDHLQSHNMVLYREFLLVDKFIHDSFEQGAPINSEYQNDICKRVKQLNMELMNEIQKHGDWGKNQK